MAELHLIGTLAQDPDGADRLADVLEAVRPDVIAVEASRAAFDRHTARGDAARAASLAAIEAKGAGPLTLSFWQRRLAKEHLYFEMFTSAGYAGERSLPLHFLDGDDPLAGDGGVGTLDDPAEEFRRADGQALAEIAAHDWRAAYEADYARARLDLEAKACLEFLLPLAQQPAYRARDRRMSRQIAALLGDGERPARPEPGRPSRVAVVCALTHLYFSEARLTIYSQLYEATTQRHITDDAGTIHDHAIVLPWLLQRS